MNVLRLRTLCAALFVLVAVLLPAPSPAFGDPHDPWYWRNHAAPVNSPTFGKDLSVGISGTGMATSPDGLVYLKLSVRTLLMPVIAFALLCLKIGFFYAVTVILLFLAASLCALRLRHLSSSRR